MQGRIQDFILGGHFPLLSVGDSRARSARGRIAPEVRGAKPRALRLGGLGERLSSPSGVRGGAPTANDFGAYSAKFIIEK